MQVLILLVPFVFVAILWDQVPDRMPIHWDLHGHANGYTSKSFGFLLIPFVNLGIALLLAALPKIHPKTEKLKVSANTIKPIRIVITAFLMVLFLHTTLATLGMGPSIGSSILIELPVLFFLLGYFLPRVQPNYFVGVRTPWTLEDPENWRLTHIMTSRLWMWASVIVIVLELLVPENSHTGLFIAYLSIIIVWPLVYSYWLFRRSVKGMRSS